MGKGPVRSSRGCWPALLLLLTLAVARDAGAEPYRDAAAVRTAGVCSGALEEMALNTVLALQPDMPQETRDEMLARYLRPLDALLTFLDSYWRTSGVGGEELSGLMERGKLHIRALVPSGTREIDAVVEPCRELGRVLGLNDALAIPAAFDAATAAVAPLVAQ